MLCCVVLGYMHTTLLAAVHSRGTHVWRVSGDSTGIQEGLFHQPAMCKVCGQLVQRLPYVFHVCLHVPTYHVHNLYVMYIAAMRPSSVDFLRTAASVATMSSLAEFWVQDTEKLRQHRRDNARLTKSRKARSEQLLITPTDPLSDWEWFLKC